MRNSFDVIVVGAGAAGSALACAIADFVPRVAIIDRTALIPAPKPSNTLQDIDPRTLALTEASKQLLVQISVWSALEELGVSPYRDMTVWDADGTGGVSFAAEEIDAAALGYILEARTLTYVLQQQLHQKDVTIIEGRSVKAFAHDAGRAEVSLDDGEQLSAELVVGADGANSILKTLAGIDSHQIDNHQRAIVCNIETTERHDAVARQRFLSTGPLAFLPVGAVGNNICSIVWSCDEALAEELLALNDAEFCSRLATASEACLGQIVQATQRFSFPLVARHAVQYQVPGLALVGDAAHVVHPLAGQGMNLGLADVASLATELKDAHTKGVGLASKKVLAAYQRKRRGDNMRMIALTQAFKHLFAEDRLAVRWLRNTGMRMVDGQPIIKQAIIKQAMGLGAENSV